MRQVDPDQLEHLAKLLDGEDGTDGALSEAFTRASTLGVTSLLSGLRPIQTWVTDTAPDLRTRAGYARLDEGDPTAGLLIAGFTPDELADFDGEVPADALLLANSMAADENTDSSVFERQHREKIDDYLIRIGAHAVSHLPGLEPHEETMAQITKLGLDWVNFTVAAGVVTTQSVALVNVYAINPVMRHYFNSPRRFLGAPGAWLPGQLGGFFKNNRAIQRMLSVPGTSGFRGRAFGGLWDSARRLLPNSRLFAGATPNTWINRFVGNDRFAHRLGYNPRVGTESVRGARAGQTRLDWVARNVYSKAQGMGAGRWSAARTAVSGAARAGGFLRFAGIGGSVAATGFSVANVVAQGNPVDAFKDDPLGYAADVAEVGFNASLTAAMVAPNPVTIGLAVGTGIVYGGLKIAENWDSVKETTGKAVEGVKNVAGGVADGAKKLAGKLNPFG